MIPVYSTTGSMDGVRLPLASTGTIRGFPMPAGVCPLLLVPHLLTWWQSLTVTCPQPSLLSCHVVVSCVLAPQGTAVLSLQFSFGPLRHKSIWLTPV